MKRFAQIKAGLGAALVLALASPAFAGEDGKEEEVRLQDCPAAVQKTIADNAGGGTIKEVERETKKDGSVVYEAEVRKADGTEADIVVAADGTLIKVETDDEDDEDGD